MVVLVIIGLLAAIVSPQFSIARERTYITVMRSDLRNFATAEESHFYDFAYYAATIATVQPRGFETSKDVTLSVNEATSTGWSATTSHIGTAQKCYLFLGSAAPVGSAHSEGLVSCS